MAQTRPHSKGRAALFRVLLLVFSIAITLPMIELVLRLALPQPASWLAVYQPHPTLPFYSMLPNTRLHVDTGETSWTIETDEHGFRYDPALHKEHTACNLLWLGDSYGFGHGLPYPESFIGQVDLRLPDVRVLNASVSGYGPTQYRRTLEYWIEQGLDFDLLVVATYVGNDFHDTKWEKTKTVSDGIIGNRNDLKSLLMRNLHIYRLAASVYHRISPGNQDSYRKVVDQLARAEAWDEPFLSDAQAIYEREMARILELGRQQGAQVAFVVLPTRQAVAILTGEARDPQDLGDAQPMLPVEKANAIFQRIGARELDMTAIVAQHPTDQAYFRFDGHLTAISSSEVADAILETLSFDCETSPGSR